MLQRVSIWAQWWGINQRYLGNQRGTFSEHTRWRGRRHMHTCSFFSVFDAWTTEGPKDGSRPFKESSPNSIRSIRRSPVSKTFSYKNLSISQRKKKRRNRETHAFQLPFLDFPNSVHIPAVLDCKNLTTPSSGSHLDFTPALPVIVVCLGDDSWNW